MNRERFEELLDSYPRTTELLLTLFFLFAMGVAGWIDGPLVNGY